MSKQSKPIQCTNFLLISSKNLQQFDYIYTNPPWGKKLSKQEKQNWSERLNISSDFAHDTCSLFFQCCLKNLTPQGYLGLLLPDAVLNIAFKVMRKEILNHQILRLVDFGKIFNGLRTNAAWIEINQLANENSEIPCFFQEQNTIQHKLSFQSNSNSFSI